MVGERVWRACIAGMRVGHDTWKYIDTWETWNIFLELCKPVYIHLEHLHESTRAIAYISSNSER